MDEDSRGAITLRSVYTHLNGQTVCKTQDMKNYIYIMFVMAHSEIRHFADV